MSDRQIITEINETAEELGAFPRDVREVPEDLMRLRELSSRIASRLSYLVHLIDDRQG